MTRPFGLIILLLCMANGATADVWGKLIFTAAQRSSATFDRHTSQPVTAATGNYHYNGELRLKNHTLHWIDGQETTQLPHSMKPGQTWSSGDVQAKEAYQ